MTLPESLVKLFVSRASQLLDGLVSPTIRLLLKENLQQRALEKLDESAPAGKIANVQRNIFELSDALPLFNLVFQHNPSWTLAFLLDAVPFLAETVNRGLNRAKIRSLVEGWKKEDTSFVKAGVTAAPWLALQGLSVAGFTPSGVAAGSLAAAWQSAIGNVAAGSLFASFQSVGAVGAIAAPWAAVLGGGVAAGYLAFKVVTMPGPEERLQKLLSELLISKEKRDKFWAPIRA